MKKTASLIVLFLAACLPSCAHRDSGGIPAPPATRRAEVTDVFHGVAIVDAYRWLEDQGSPETRAWIDAQNAHSLALLQDRPLLPAIRDRLTDLMRVDHTGIPIEAGGRYFLWKKKASDDLPILHLRDGLEGADRVLLDPHLLSPDHTTSVTLLDVSRDGKAIVYGVRHGGEDEIEMRVMDVNRGADLPDRFPRALYDNVSFTLDGTAFYYTWRTRAAGARIRRHAIGASPESDREIFGEGHGPGDWIGASVSGNGRYLIVTVSHGWSSSEIYFQDLSAGGPVKPVVTGLSSQFDAGFAGDTLVMRTDWQAPRGRIVAVDLRNPAPEKWRDLVPEGPDAIQEMSLVGGRLFVDYLHDVASRIDIYSLDGKPHGHIELPGIGTAGAPSGRWESREAFYDFVSFTVPRTSFRLDPSTGAVHPWARDEVAVDPDRFEVRQVWSTSKDGTRIPIFLVHRKDLPLDGNRPTLLYGYGGFDVSITPSFNPTAVWWAEQGGVYAVANLRGGAEFGEAWHRAGMLGNKQHVFDDFIGAAEYLIQNRYTRPSRLAIRGASNGGLLVGAALTQRPDLFQAVLCEYPDLDMLRYPYFDNNNPPALLEYGDARDPEQFKYLAAYSPYQKVQKGVPYPAVLFTTGDADTRVPPLQARRMTAALQWATVSDRPVLLLYDTHAGHSGGKPFGRIVDDLALEIAFLSWQLGMDPPA